VVYRTPNEQQAEGEKEKAGSDVNALQRQALRKCIA
jgi:hypothetical protein